MGKYTNWAGRKDLDCLIICGGLGTRMLPLTINKQKTLLNVSQHPLIYYVIEYWKKYCHRFVFVTHYRADDVKDFVKGLDCETEIIFEKEAGGIAKALELAKDSVGQHFVTVLGDCLCTGEFIFPPMMNQGIGVTRTRNPLAIQQSYAVETDDGRISKVIEKPEKIINDKLGMGIYFFSKDIFPFISSTPVSEKTGKIELTDVIQQMADSDQDIHEVFFNGSYINVSYPEDLVIADHIAKSIVAQSDTEEVSFVDGSTTQTLPEHNLARENHFDKVLVLRTVPIPIFQQTVRHLRSLLPCNKLEALCQPSCSDAIGEVDGIDGIQEFPDEGLFRFRLSSISLIRKLRKRNYDGIIVIYNNPDRIGYFKLEMLSKLCCKNTYGAIPRGDFFQLAWWMILRKRQSFIMRTCERFVFYTIKTFMGLNQIMKNMRVF